MSAEQQYQRIVPRAPAWSVVADALPIAALIVFGLWYWLASAPAALEPMQRHNSVKLKSVTANSAETLHRIYAELGYQWLPEDPIPALSLRAFPPDLSETAVQRKKRLFFSSLLPLVLAENHIVRVERTTLRDLFAAGALEPGTSAWNSARRIAARYKVEGDINEQSVRDTLLQRIGEIPPSLALAQAANESAWGTSRFAREGNNLFGQWTWDASQGMVPRRRDSDADHYVRRFETLRASVRAYVRNLNTHPAYEELRDHRAELQRIGKHVSGMRLASGLTAYSERGMAYVNEIREMIAYNRLQRVNDAQLALSGE